ncbi:hypothetical protein IFM89_023885 [Coptis chinensis]|uniref:Uncharacterized protein n=1 Tax=Coptis chinensis TaxID=261450 RepID=A0A835M0V8_9MAGN|nr:hypothetical protein IFM89_023885 [Coptis chinensis]
MNIGVSNGTEFKVGQNLGWRMPYENDTAMYSQWAGTNRFLVGDSLPTIKVSSEGNGCKIEWSYVTDPLKGWNFEGLVSTISSSLQDMAKNMEEALKAD